MSIAIGLMTKPVVFLDHDYFVKVSQNNGNFSE
jgi:hypothetical protein